MIDLLKIEWLKIKNYRVFILMNIFFVIGLVASNYLAYSGYNNVVKNTDAKVILDKFNPFEFKYVWETVSYISGLLVILPSMLMIILTTNEYTFRTNRQNIIDGWSRQQFLQIKISLAFLFALFSTVIVIICGFVFGWSSKSDLVFDGFSHIGYFFLKALSYNLFAVMLSVLIKKTGFGIGVFFIYLGAENILSQILDSYSLVIKKMYEIDLGSMGDYLPMNASDGLLTFPNSPLKTMTKNVLPTEYNGIVFCLAIFYLILFYFISSRKIIKSDM